MSSEGDELFWRDSTTPSPTPDIRRRHPSGRLGVNCQFDQARRSQKRSQHHSVATYNASGLGAGSRVRQGGMRSAKRPRMYPPSTTVHDASRFTMS